MIFYRILDNKLYQVYETNTMGFNLTDASYIPDDYLEQQEFVVMRTAHGIGDWGIISAMPRLLKQKYPNCKVYVPSEKLLKKLFGNSHKNAYVTFYNNPHVDDFIDSIDGDIFHDQYRIYDNNNINTPLLEQMLKFWQFNEDEYKDSQPELYWTEEEIQLGNSIIETHTTGEFGCLLVSDRFGTQRGKYDAESYQRDTRNITQVLQKNKLPYFYWSYKPLRDTPFDFIDKALDLRHIDLRIQLYIKSKAKVNISNQCGTNHLVVRYSDVYEAQRQYPIKHNFIKDITYISDYAPINADYFLNMEVAGGGPSKSIIKQDGSLVKVKDIIKFFKNKDNLQKVKASLQPDTWQYFNCMEAEFRHNVAGHHELGWENLTEEYYNSLSKMSDDEIEDFLKTNPVEFDNGFIKHSYHRACSMIGRLINGKPYIPFYMKTSQIYDEPRKHDGKHRVKPLIDNVYGIKEVLNLGIPASEFTITQSGILALMGIRKNDDIDIIISSKIRNELFNGDETFMRLPNGIEIFEKGKSKFMHFGATNEDQLINHYSINVNGINFLEPRFYFRKKRKDREKDINDWKGITKFFDMENEKGYPWNQLSEEQWGL